jgi:hypothetical protein
MFLDGLFGVQVVVTGPLTFLNWVFAFAFPLLPYELFTFMPWVIAYMAKKGTFSIGTLTGFTTLFPAVFFGIVHALGTVQFIQVWFGLPGICGALPPPTPGDTLWCKTMSIHGALTVPVGWYMLYLTILEFKSTGSLLVWKKTELDLYFRSAILYIFWGTSLWVPYIGELSISGTDVLFGPGLYTSLGWLNRGVITYGLSEVISATGILTGGLYFMLVYSTASAKKGSGMV